MAPVRNTGLATTSTTSATSNTGPCPAGMVPR
jgi:hypothetical protein